MPALPLSAGLPIGSPFSRLGTTSSRPTKRNVTPESQTQPSHLDRRRERLLYEERLVSMYAYQAMPNNLNLQPAESIRPLPYRRSAP